MSTQLFYTLDDLRRWDEIAPALEPPARLAVIGDPIAHSRSPQMMNAALEKRGIYEQYIRVQVPPGSVKETLELFARHAFRGVNCTIPHKFEALDAVDEVDPLAQKLGAVNTVRIRNGNLAGFNSDGPGFLRAVEEAFGKSVRDLRILIMGAGGGAGHAVAVQCALAGCPQLTLMNRNTDKLNSTISVVRAVSTNTTLTRRRWSGLDLEASVNENDLIVNATSIGMHAGQASVPPQRLLRAGLFVFDMVYRSDGETPLVSAAKAAGAKTCDGLTLLLHQGAISFAHWFGEPVPLEAMRAGLMNHR